MSSKGRESTGSEKAVLSSCSPIRPFAGAPIRRCRPAGNGLIQIQLPGNTVAVIYPREPAAEPVLAKRHESRPTFQ